jgi:hypothetical protein
MAPRIHPYVFFIAGGQRLVEGLAAALRRKGSAIERLHNALGNNNSVRCKRDPL